MDGELWQPAGCFCTFENTQLTKFQHIESAFVVEFKNIHNIPEKRSACYGRRSRGADESGSIPKDRRIFQEYP